MSEFREEIERMMGKRITKIVMVIIGIILMWVLVSALFSFWPFSSAARVIQKVTSAESIINNYEWFYDQHNVINATKSKLRIAEKNKMEEAPGIAMVLEGMIAEYNSKSKQITRNLWKAEDLQAPSQFRE